MRYFMQDTCLAVIGVAAVAGYSRHGFRLPMSRRIISLERFAHIARRLALMQPVFARSKCAVAHVPPALLQWSVTRTRRAAFHIGAGADVSRRSSLIVDLQINQAKRTSHVRNTGLLRERMGPRAIQVIWITGVQPPAPGAGELRVHVFQRAQVSALQG